MIEEWEIKRFKGIAANADSKAEIFEVKNFVSKNSWSIKIRSRQARTAAEDYRFVIDDLSLDEAVKLGRLANRCEISFHRGDMPI